jgi:hypothetical protein
MSPVPNQPGSALAIPDDLRESLLRQQTEQLVITRAPRVKVLRDAALFEFMDTNVTARSFEGVILNIHNKNALWPKPFGEQARTEEEKLPACASPDGRYGIPRPGFAHLALNGAEARGDERIDCSTCPYNQFGSVHHFPNKPQGNGKGKAVTNSKIVFVMLPDRELPVELQLPATSIKPFDDYVLSVSNRGIPVQTLVTKFEVARVTRGNNTYAAASFSEAGTLNEDTWLQVLARRNKYLNLITPRDPLAADVDFSAVSGEPGGTADDEDAPF